MVPKPYIRFWTKDSVPLYHTWAGTLNLAFRKIYSRMGGTGLEHIQKSPGKQTIPTPDGAESGAVLPSELIQVPPALTEIIAKWPRLSASVQAAILAIIQASA
jgi:hypothetical protein